MGKNIRCKKKNILKEIEDLVAAQNGEEEESEEIQNLKHLLSQLQSAKKDELKKNSKSKLTWPCSTMNGKLRTIEGIRAIVEEIENDPDIVSRDPDFCKGVKGRSLLLDYPHFHMIIDVPCEYMHIVCLGVVKRLVCLTFKVGENRPRETKRKLSCPTLFNEMIKNIQLTREFSRRCRNLDFGVMKAAEFRNIILFFFPIVLDCIEDEFKSEKKMWLHLVFMIRSCTIPNNEFRNVNENDVNSACAKFYKISKKLFGPQNCSYSIHVVSSHLLLMRGNRPFTYKSAFKFENFFAEMKNLFHAGSVSPLKQILQNCYVKRMLEYHVCDKPSFYSPVKKPKPGTKFNPGKENNSLVYIYNENETYTMYSINEIINEETFTCNVQGKFKLKSHLTPEYDWSTVGVFKLGPKSEEKVTINKRDICGKVLKVNNYLITCPHNVLHEN